MLEQKPIAEHMEPVMVNREHFAIAGLRYEGRNEAGEIPAMWEVFIPRLHELTGKPGEPVTCYGASRLMPGVPPERGFEYLAGVEVPSLENLPAGMVGWEIPATAYVVFTAHDTTGIMPVMEYVYGTWFPQSKTMRMGDGPMLEVYPPTFDTDKLIDLYFPARPA